MSFGFKVINSSGQYTISDSTYNLVYVGRGVLARSGAAPNVSYGYNVLGIDGLIVGFYDFVIDVNAATAVVPFFTCPGYCSISYVRQISSTRWEIECFATSQPTIYCFTRLPPGTPVTGFGLAVLRADGGTAYLSTQPHLLARAVAPAGSYSSNVQFYGSTGGLQAYAAEPAAANTYVGGTGMGVPIFHYASGNSAARWNSSTYSQYFFARVASYSGGNVAVRWAVTGFTSVFRNGLSYDAPGDSNLVMVADGAYFN